MKIFVICVGVSLVVPMVAMQPQVNYENLKQQFIDVETIVEVNGLLGFDTAQYTLYFDPELANGFYLKAKDGSPLYSDVYVRALNASLAHVLEQFVFGKRHYNAAKGAFDKYPTKDDDDRNILHVLRCIQSPDFINKGLAESDRPQARARTQNLRQFVAKRTENNDLWSGHNHFFDRCRANRGLLLGMCGVSVCLMAAAASFYWYTFNQPQEQEQESEHTQQAESVQFSPEGTGVS